MSKTQKVVVDFFSRMNVESARNWILGIFVFLLPWFYLPLSFEYYETGKNILLIGSVLILMLLWVMGMFKKRKVTIIKTRFDKTLLLWVAAFVIGAFFSLHFMTSIWGYYSRISESVVGVMALVALYFLVVNTVTDKKELARVSKLWIGSVSLFALFVVLQYFGLLSWLWEALNSGVTTTNYSDAFNPLGSNTLTPFVLLATLPLVLGQLLGTDSTKKRTLLRFLGGTKLFIVVLAVLLAVQRADNLTKVSAIVLLVLVLGAALYAYRERVRVSVETSGGLLLAAAAFLLVFFMPSYAGSLNVPGINHDPILDSSIAWEVTSRALTADGVKSFAFGSGPETYVYDFTRLKPVDYNNNEFWSARYSNNPIELLDVFQGVGIIGVLVLLLLAYKILRFVLKHFGFPAVKLSKGNEEMYPFALSLKVSLVALLVTSFSVVNWVFLFLALALMMKMFYLNNSAEANENTVVLSSARKSNGIDSDVVFLAFKVVVVFVTGAGVILFHNYSAEVSLRNSINSLRVGDFDTALSEARKAVDLAPSKPHLRRNLALVSLRSTEPVFAQIQQMQEQPTQEGQEEQAAQDVQAQLQFLSALVNQSVNEVQNAVNLNRFDIESQESSAQVYATAHNLSGGARYAEETLVALRNTITVDPFNPNHYVNLGLFLQSIGRDQEAEAAFINAIQLRPDNPLAVLALGSFLESADRLDEARQVYEVTLGLETVQEGSAFANELNARLKTLGQNGLNPDQDALQIGDEGAGQEEGTEVTATPDGGQGPISN
ncbi:MAG: tetratricopeptide repeat protein [Candidatus Dojkabacteria bacterium]